MAEMWENIIVHCSDSIWGSASEIRKWHLEKGWNDIGYHFVIPNGTIRPGFYLSELDGSIEVGRELDGDPLVEEKEIGAHAYGYNRNSIGICLIGQFVFSNSQLNALQYLINSLRLRFNIPLNKVLGHYEAGSSKTCPNINMQVVRRNMDPQGLFAPPRTMGSGGNSKQSLPG